MESASLPLILAVTGHRDLHPEDIPRVRTQLGELFAELAAESPHTPILLLSALGPGADRLAARVALETPGVRLGAVLPWPAGIDDAGLHRGGDRAEFDDLLSRADLRLCLPLPEDLGAEGRPLAEDARQACYAAAGRYLTRHCLALVAIWDGEERADSQTWQMIRWHLEGTAAPFAAAVGHLDEPETGPIWHLPCRRGSSAGPGPDPSRRRRPPAVRPEAFGEIARNFDRFNADVARIGPTLGGRLAVSKAYLSPGEEEAALPGPLSFLLDRFAMADQLASWWQRLSHGVLVAVLGFILLTVTLFECYAHVAPSRVALLLGYLAVFGLGTLLVWQARRWRIYNRYLDYRALAEALRVHWYWKLAGLRESAADYYLRSCRSQLDWIRAALRAWTVPSGEHDCRHACPDGAAPDPAVLRRIRDRWMAAQQDYFQRSRDRDQGRAHLFHRCARGGVILSLAATGVQTARLLGLIGASHHPPGHDGATHALIMTIAMGGVLAGLFHEYLEKRLFEKQARSYDWMASLYGTALRRFDALVEAGEFAQARSLIRELGCEALAENADWVIYHREREPEMKAH